MPSHPQAQKTNLVGCASTQFGRNHESEKADSDVAHYRNDNEGDGRQKAGTHEAGASHRG